MIDRSIIGARLFVGVVVDTSFLCVGDSYDVLL